MGSLALKGRVMDKSNGKGLMGATVSIVAENGNGVLGNGKEKAVVKKTAVKGGFNVKVLADGMYKIQVSKPSYKDVEVMAAVTNGELSVVDVVLEKLNG